jgi:DNA (cytosine-5)-methyltransferase 1
MFSEQSPPNNCLSCALQEERDIQVSPLELKTDGGVTHGLAFAGKQFHLEDFVLYRADSGPCNIGHIVGVTFEHRSAFVTVRKVGRISDLGRLLPAKMIKDEVGFLFLSSRFF